MTTEANNADAWIDVIDSMPQYRHARDKRAPYKPLLLLWLIARVTNGDDPEVRFEDAESDLKSLLAEFRVGRTEPKPQDPFVRLGTSPELWKVTDQDGNDISGSQKLTFLRNEATGRISEQFERAIGDAQIREQVVRHILFAEFPETTHEDVLSRIGLRLDGTSTAKRDTRFREIVLLAYEKRCSICDLGVILQEKSVGIDAAHLKMHSKNGPSVIENGVALCVLHHRLFDHGAIGLAPRSGGPEILVSQHLDVLNHSSRHLLDLSRKPMRVPQKGYPPPAEEYIDWHYENLFKQPARN